MLLRGGLCRIQVNSFDPDLILSNGRTYKQFRYEQLINKQAQLAYLYQGGISIEETDAMTEFDVDILRDSLIEIKEAEADAQRRAANPNAMRSAPKKSRFSLE